MEGNHVSAYVYEAWAGKQIMGVLFVYGHDGEPWTGVLAESFIWGGDHYNHYDINERKPAADLLRLWRRFGFAVSKHVLGDATAQPPNTEVLEVFR